MRSIVDMHAWHKRTAQLALALSLIMLSALCWSDTQRMLLPKQSFSIPSGGSASAGAFCLDSGAKSPNPRSVFTSAPPSLGDIRVRVAGQPDISLQQAIDSKILEVRGELGHSSLEFRSLLPSGDIQVNVRRNSVVTPADNSRTEDLIGLPQLTAGASTVGQDDLWNARFVHGAAKLGLPVDSFARSGYTTDPSSLAGAATWVKTQTTQGKASRSFVLQRIVSQSTEAPVYVLFTDKSAPRAYKGNESLADAGKAIRTDWGDTATNGRPRVVLTAEDEFFNDDLDLDAARLTLEVSASGLTPEAAAGGGGDILRPGRPAAFSFEPPPGGGPPGGNYVYRGRQWPIAVSRKDGAYSATQDIPARGSATVVSRTAQLLGRMAAAVRRVIAFYPDRLMMTADRDELVRMFESEVKDAARQAFTERPSLRQEEGKTPKLIVVVDQQAIQRQIIVDINVDELLKEDTLMAGAQ